MISTLLVAVLKAAPGVTAIVGEGALARITPDILPQKPGSASTPWLPALVYQQIGGTTDYTQDGPAIISARIQIDAYAMSRIAADALQKAVRDALHEYAGDPEGIQDFKAEGMRSFYEDDGAGVRLYRTQADYFAYARDAAA